MVTRANELSVPPSSSEDRTSSSAPTTTPIAATPAVKGSSPKFSIGDEVYAPCFGLGHYKLATITGVQADEGTVSVSFHPKTESVYKDVTVKLHQLIVPYQPATGGQATTKFQRRKRPLSKAALAKQPKMCTEDERRQHKCLDPERLQLGLAHPCDSDTEEPVIATIRTSAGDAAPEDDDPFSIAWVLRIKGAAFVRRRPPPWTRVDPGLMKSAALGQAPSTSYADVTVETFQRVMVNVATSRIRTITDDAGCVMLVFRRLNWLRCAEFILKNFSSGMSTQGKAPCPINLHICLSSAEACEAPHVIAADVDELSQAEDLRDGKTVSGVFPSVDQLLVPLDDVQLGLLRALTQRPAVFSRFSQDQLDAMTERIIHGAVNLGHYRLSSLYGKLSARVEDRFGASSSRATATHRDPMMYALLSCLEELSHSQANASANSTLLIVYDGAIAGMQERLQLLLNHVGVASLVCDSAIEMSELWKSSLLGRQALLLDLQVSDSIVRGGAVALCAHFNGIIGIGGATRPVVEQLQLCSGVIAGPLRMRRAVLLELGVKEVAADHSIDESLTHLWEPALVEEIARLAAEEEGAGAEGTQSYYRPDGATYRPGENGLYWDMLMFALDAYRARKTEKTARNTTAQDEESIELQSVTLIKSAAPGTKRSRKQMEFDFAADSHEERRVRSITPFSPLERYHALVELMRVQSTTTKRAGNKKAKKGSKTFLAGMMLTPASEVLHGNPEGSTLALFDSLEDEVMTQLVAEVMNVRLG